MKKILAALCLFMILSGCKTSDPEQLNSDLDAVFSVLEESGTYRVNNMMEHYSYYLPSDMSEEALDSDAIVLRYGDVRAGMNLNISGIVNARYYPEHVLEDEGLFAEENMAYRKEGTYTDYDGISKNYIYSLYRYEDTYIISLLSNDMSYYASTDEFRVREVTAHLLTIMKNTSVATDEVASIYANKDIIDYRKKQIDLFDVGLPDNGAISSLLVDDAVVGDGLYYDGKVIEDDSDTYALPEDDEVLPEDDETGN